MRDAPDLPGGLPGLPGAAWSANTSSRMRKLLRGSGPLDEIRRRQIAMATHRAPPPPSASDLRQRWLVRNWRRAAFAAFTNVTLLDHLLSVTEAPWSSPPSTFRPAGNERRRNCAAVSPPWPRSPFCTTPTRSWGSAVRRLGRRPRRCGDRRADGRFGLPAFLARHGVTLTPRRCSNWSTAWRSRRPKAWLKSRRSIGTTAPTCAWPTGWMGLPTNPAAGRAPDFGIDGALRVIATV